MADLSRVELDRILATARVDPERFMAQALVIKNKALQMVPLRLNACQRKVHAALQRQRAAGKPMRAIVLKPRQIGCSVYFQGRLFVSMMAWPGARGLVLTHERDASQEMLGVGRRFIELMDEEVRPNATPTLNKIRFHDIPCSDGPYVLNSELTVDTATGKEVGRSRTINFVQASEMAFWPDAKRSLHGLLEAVPELPDTLVVLESTANGTVGPGQEFYDWWRAAESGDSSFVPIFLPWFLHEEYVAEVPPNMAYAPHEEEWAARFTLTPQQIAWYREKVRTKFKGDIEACQCEYPFTPGDAFLRSGGPLFPTSILVDYKTKAEGVPCTDGYTDGQSFTSRPNGQLRVWTPPELGVEYMLAADVASGLEHGDYSAAAIINRTTHRAVAEWFGKIDAVVFALTLFHLGKWYNWATVAIEVNFNLATQTELVDRLRYPNPYVWRVEDNLNGGYTTKIGWITNQRTRVALIDDMNYGLKAKMIGIPSVRAIDQLLTFDATAHESDDLAMAYMIAWHCHLRSRTREGFFPRQVVEPDLVMVTDPYQDAPSAAVRAAWKDRDRMLRGESGLTRASQLVTDVTDAVGPRDPHERDPFPEIPY